MTIKLTKDHYLELVKRGYSLDQIYLLMEIEEGQDMTVFTEDSMKLEALHQSLFRKGLITDEDKLTIPGQELLDFMTTKIAAKLVKKKPSSKDFDEWWNAFPSTDHFDYRGKVFTGSRGMRVKKEQCKLKFNAILNEGVYTAQQIINATKYVVTLKKESSLKKRTNELTYLQNSYTFLNDSHYVPFIELSDKQVKISDDSYISNGTDI